MEKFSLPVKATKVTWDCYIIVFTGKGSSTVLSQKPATL